MPAGLTVSRVWPASSGPTRRCRSCARSASGSPLSDRSRACAWPPACTSRRRRPTSSARWSRAGPTRRSPPPTRSPRRTTSPPRCAEEAEVHGRRGEGVDAYAANVTALVDSGPQVTLDDGADLLTLLHERHPERLGEHARRHRGDDDRPAAPARARGRGAARLPGARRQRGRHRAPLQRPLRHRPVDARRHPARHQPAAGRPHDRRARLRLHRQGRGDARPRRRRPGDRVRDRPDAGARGADGGLRGDDGAARGRARRRLRHRHGQPRRAEHASTSRA